MHPRLTTLQLDGVSVPIGTYGALLVLALGVGAWLALRRGLRAGLEEGALISSLALALAGGFVGAFALSVAVRAAQLGGLRAAFAQPGIVYFGALFAGAAALAVAARSFGLPVRLTLDAMLPAVPVAHAIGRVGCYFGGCCYGAASELPWAVQYPGDAVSRHPWPLYEAAALCVLAVLFWRPAQLGGGYVSGRRAGGYVLSYACVRFLLEPLRGDAVRGVFGAAGMSTSQIIAVAVLGVSVYVAVKRLRLAL